MALLEETAPEGQHHEPRVPKPIRRLEESLINRIAAGEIIHRPASALKELLENSLDAGSTSIKVTVKDGGLKLLQIQDNGCGIQKADLPILAERFTTSKLSTFSDLSSLMTYGFRGEALASISHIAHLSVITKTRKDGCAWKVSYLDGALCPSKPGLTAEPKPCAGNDGTVITVEDMFYNTLSRLSALRSSSEEYARILDVMTKYAVHNPHVSFTCKKSASPSPDLMTPSGSTVDQAVRLLYGQTVFRHLIKSTISSDTLGSQYVKDLVHDDIDMDDAKHKSNKNARDGQWEAQALFTNINYQSKKTVFLLFINHRLVESTRMKKAIENVYANLLPKGAFPFVYLSIDIDPQAVDVNVHPTKREVHFLNEELITGQIADELQRKLAEQSSSRVFTYQTLLPGASGVAESNRKGKEKEAAVDEEDYIEEVDARSTQGSGKDAKKMYSKNKVRTSQKHRTLDSMFPVAPSQVVEVESANDASKPAHSVSSKSHEIKESECYLTSVINLRDRVQKNKHNLMTEIIEKHIFVGVVDLRRSLSLIQHSTNLYLVNHNALAEELFYQLGLRQFGNMRRLKLDPPPPVRHLVKLAVSSEDSLKTSGIDLTEDQVTDKIVDRLVSRADMLDEYFSFRINSQGKLESIPYLLKEYTPNLDKLPLFLMRLGPQVNWTSEQECFSSFLRELAYFYSPAPLPGQTSEDEPDTTKAANWQIEHSLFPNLRKYFIAPKSLLERDIVQVASLPELYRVFERC